MKVVVDGFNLALEKGTGVATYARNLTSGLRETGHEVHVLYGRPGASGKNDLLREIAFFDENFGARNSFLGKTRHVIEALVNPFARPISSINLSGTVIYEQFLSRLPVFDQLWNSSNLYEQAALRFYLSGRRLRVLRLLKAPISRTGPIHCQSKPAGHLIFIRCTIWSRYACLIQLSIKSASILSLSATSLSMPITLSPYQRHQKEIS